MSNNVKTLLFVGVAAVLAVLAALSAPSSPEPEFFNDTGELFFPEFTDPMKPASLEVWEFDEETGKPIGFSVKQEKGRWTIPSHFDYPADAKDRMAQAASMLIGLRKESVRSDRKDDHAAFGVVDPRDESASLEGRGMRITFKDSAGTVLADIILGKEVEGHEGMRYARLPGKKRTYTCKIETELSTKFEDWIDRDILDASSWDLEKIVFDNYRVDERTYQIKRGEKLVLFKKDYEWNLEGLAEGEETNRDKVNEVVDALTALKIVDVQRKPKGLTAMLKRAEGIEAEILYASLKRHGFYLSRDGDVVSNEGDLIVQTKKGIVYTLKFGEVAAVYGVSHKKKKKEGKDAESDGKTANGETQGSKPADDSHRYLMITARFDESLLDRPKGEPLPKEHMDKRRKARELVERVVSAVEAYREKHGKLPETLAALTEGDKPQLSKLEKDPWGHDLVYEIRKPAKEAKDGKEGKEAEKTAKGENGEKKKDGGEEKSRSTFVVRSLAEDGKPGGEGVNEDISSDALDREDELRRTFDDFEEYRKKVEEGKKKATELTDRFGPWYYVIDAEHFRKLQVSRKDLVKKQEKKKTSDDDKDGGQGAPATSGGDK